MGWTTPTDRSTGYVVTASDWNIVEDDLAFLYGDTGWTRVTYTNSWVDQGTDQVVGYRKIGTHVQLRGTMKSGTINTAAFTLPSGYRPPATLPFAVASNGAFGVLLVDSGGVVTPQIGSNLNFAVNGVMFDTLA